jgi:hypothetical protein
MNVYSCLRCTAQSRQLFHLSHEYIGNAAHREALIDYAERFVIRRFAGAQVLAQPQRKPLFASA